MNISKMGLGLFILTILTASATSAQQQITQTVTKLNKGCNNGCSVIDIPELNNNPDAIILATPILENGRNPNPHPIGAYYMYLKKWSIFNLDNTPIAEGTKFKVEYYVKADTSKFVYVVPKGYDACIDHAGLNNEPNASVKAFPTGPPSRGALFNRNEIKVEYNAASSKWCITNVDPSFAVPIGTAYSIAFLPGTVGSNVPKPSPAPTPTISTTLPPKTSITPLPAPVNAATKTTPVTRLVANGQAPKTVPIIFDRLNDFVAKGLPAPAEMPAGNLDQAAILMAQTISKADKDSLPTLLAALQTAGFTIVDENRKVLLKPAGDGMGQGLLFYDWETVGMLRTAQSQIGTTLDKLTAMMSKDTPEIPASRLSSVMLQDLRQHANSTENPFVRFWARLIIGLGKAAAKPVDLTTSPSGDVNLSQLQASLWTRRVVGDFYAFSNHVKIGRLRKTRMSPSIFVTERALSDFGPSFQPVFYTPANECQLTENEALILDAASFGMTAGHDAVYDLIKEAYEHTHTEHSLEKFAKGMNVVNLVLAWTKLVAAVTSIHGEIEVEGSLPLIRTKSSNIDEPGNRVLMKAKFWNEVGRKQMLNCVRLALNASTGLDLSLPTDGPLEEKAVDWHFAGDNEIRVNDAATRNTQNFVSFKSPNGKSPQDQVTEKGGISEMNLVGLPKVPAVVYFKSMEVEKQANVMVAITLKSAKDVRQNLIDIAGIAGNMAVGGPMALLLAVPEIGFRLPYTAAHATIPVTDHEPCDGKWKGSITYTVVDTATIKHNVIPGKGPMTITEGGSSNSDHVTTYSGTINVNGNDGVANVSFEESMKINESIYGQVWCSPLQGFKGTRGQSSSGFQSSGSGSGNSHLSISFEPTKYAISFSVPGGNATTSNSSQGSANNDCKNNKPIISNSNYSSTGTFSSPNLPSAEGAYGSEKGVLKDSATGTIYNVSSTSADGSTTSTHTVVVTITWNLKMCD